MNTKKAATPLLVQVVGPGNHNGLIMHMHAADAGKIQTAWYR